MFKYLNLGGVLFLICMSAIICLEDKSDMYTTEEEEGITWKQVHNSTVLLMYSVLHITTLLQMTLVL